MTQIPAKVMEVQINSRTVLARLRRERRVLPAWCEAVRLQHGCVPGFIHRQDLLPRFITKDAGVSRKYLPFRVRAPHLEDHPPARRHGHDVGCVVLRQVVREEQQILVTLPPETVPARTVEFGRNDQKAGCHASDTAPSKS